MAKWFVLQDGDDAGPFSAEQIRRFAVEGRIQPDSLLRKSDAGKAFSARQVRGLLFEEARQTEPEKPANPESTVPTEPEQPSMPVVNTSPAETVRRRGSKGPWILLAAAACLVSGGIAFVAATKLNAAQSLQTADIEEPAPASPGQELEKEITAKKDERDKLDDKVRTLKKESKSLEDKKEGLEEEIKNLTTFLEELRRWQTVDVAFVSPEQFIVGLSSGSTKDLKLVIKARGKKSLLISRAVTKAGIPVIASDPSIPRRLYQSAEEASMLRADLLELVTRFYRRHQFESLGATDQWVTFWNVQRNQQEFGIYEDATHDSLTYVSQRGKPLTIPRQHVLDGTAIKGAYGDVVSGLSEAHFLDYCLLRVAQKMQTPQHDSAHALGVHVVVDGINRSLSESFEDPPLPDLPEIKAEKGIAAFAGAAIAVSHFLYGIARYERQQARIDETRNEAIRLENAVAYLEDEVLGKLTDIGVHTYDRALLKNLASKFGVEPEKNASISEFGRDVLLTHALVIEVKSPKRHGDYHLAVRLIDLIESKTLFAANADRVEETLDDVARRRGSYRAYHLDSGRLALLGESDLLNPVEDPVLVQRGKGIGVRRKNLVYVENDPSSDTMYYRPLFAKARVEVPASLRNSISMVKSPHDIPPHDLVRYVTCRTAQKCLPLAGRVTGVNGDRAIVTIGKSSGIRRGDSLRVLRYYDAQFKNISFDNGLAATERRLPIRLNVVDVHDYHSEVVVPKTGFEDIWYSQYELSPGDLAVPVRTPKLALGFVPPLTNPEWNVSFDVSASRRRDLSRNSARGRRWFDNSVRLADRFANEMHEGFKGLNIGTRVLGRPRVDWRQTSRGKTAQEQQIDLLEASGASHAMVGEVKVKSENWIDVRMTFVPLDGEPGHEPIDSMNFPLKPESLPR